MEQGVIKYPTFGVIGALFVTLAIGLGAYGAHGLEDAFPKLPEWKGHGEMRSIIKCFMVWPFCLGNRQNRSEKSKIMDSFGNSYVLGSYPFSFSIYAWVFGGPDGLIMVTPLADFHLSSLGSCLRFINSSL